MSRKKYIFILSTFSLLLISIGISSVFIPIKKQDHLLKQIKYWKTQKKTLEKGYIATHNITISWKKYSNQINTKIEANIKYLDKQIEVYYFQEKNKQWIYNASRDQFVILPEIKEDAKSTVIYNIISLFISNGIEDIDVIEKENDKDKEYTWDFTKEDVAPILNKVLKENRELMDSDMVTLYIQSYLIKEKRLASKENISQYLEKDFLNKLLQEMELEGTIRIITAQRNLNIQINHLINQQPIKFEQEIRLYDSDIEIIPIKKDKLIPIEEFLLFR